MENVKKEVAQEIPVQEQLHERICPTCGHKNDNDANFCEYCGYKISEICPNCWKNEGCPCDCHNNKC